MHPTFKKLQLKDQTPLLIWAVPDEFVTVLEAVEEDTAVVRTPEPGSTYSFLLAFVRQPADIEHFGACLTELVADDALVWFAYPKKSSKRYRTEISRDNGWQPLGDLGYEAVRQVALDGDWSALRFRKAEHIGKMTRRKSFAMSAKGKAKTSGS